MDTLHTVAEVKAVTEQVPPEAEDMLQHLLFHQHTVQAPAQVAEDFLLADPAVTEITAILAVAAADRVSIL